METYARMLLRIYDKKMMNGEITFGMSGISKEDFTNMCMNPEETVLSREKTLRICECMKLSEEEREKLLGFVEEYEKLENPLKKA